MRHVLQSLTKAATLCAVLRELHAIPTEEELEKAGMRGFQNVFLKLSQPVDDVDVLDITAEHHHVNRLNDVFRRLLTDGLIEAVFRQANPFGGEIRTDLFNGSMENNILIDMQEIQNYGCHCLFGEKWRKGHDKPVNPVDTKCKELTSCYKCCSYDHEVEQLPGDCDPIAEDYLAPSMIQVQLHGVMGACLNENGGDVCKSRICSCDTQFVFDLLQMLAPFGNELFDPAPQHLPPAHATGEFDFDQRCVPGVPNHAKKECCGVYPKRFPYPVRAQRDCCVTKTYNPLILRCCKKSEAEGILTQGVCPDGTTYQEPQFELNENSKPLP